MKKLFLTILFLFSLATFADGAVDRYVGKNGVDTGACTNINAPCLTITYGIQQMQQCDTLNIRVGTYLEDVGGPTGGGPHPPSGQGFPVLPANVPAGWGVTGCATTVQGFPGEIVTVLRIKLYNSPMSYIIYKNLRSGSATLNGTVLVGGQSAGNVPHHIKFDGLEVQNPQKGEDSNMNLGSFDDHIWVTNTKLHNPFCDSNMNPSGGAYNIYQTSSSAVIEFSEIYNSDFYGIHQTNSDITNPQIPPPINNIYRYNYFHHNAILGTTVGCFWRGGGALLMSAGGGNQAYGNLFYRNALGLNIGSADNNIAFNNTFYDNGTAGQPWSCNPPGSPGGDQCLPAGGGSPLTTTGPSSGGTNIRMRNNIVFGNRLDALYTADAGAGLQTSNNLFTDPQFNSIIPGCGSTGAAGCTGFQPASGTAINAGTPNISAGVTIPACNGTNGPLCYNGSAPDIGYFESGGGGASPTVAISSPTIAATYVTTTTPITLGGTSTNSTSISWVNDQGGGTTCSGTSTWTCSAITLAADKVNAITITATGPNGSATAILRVAYSFPALVGSWAFDENGGTTALDRSGFNNNGTFGAGVAYTTATVKYGISALSFSGGVVTVPDSASLRLIGGWTISAQIYPFAAHTDFRAVLIKNPGDYFLYSTANCPSNTPIAGGTVGETCAPAPLSINTYSCVASTYDGTNLKIYVNKTLVQTASATGLLGSGTGTLQIGGSQFNEFFDGALDNLRLYNYDVGPTQINTDCDTGIVPAGVANFKISGATGLKLKGATAAEIGH